MNTIFILLFLVTIPALIVGLIKPQLFSRIFRHEFSRKGIGLIIGGAMLGSLVMVGATADPVTESTMKTDQASISEIKEEPIEESAVDSLNEESIETDQVQQQGSEGNQSVASVASPTNTNQQNSASTSEPNNSPAPPATSSGVVKKSNSGLCHAPGTTYYERTKDYTPYDSVQKCLDSGGSLPKN